MKYQCIEQHKQEFPIVVMCHVRCRFRRVDCMPGESARSASAHEKMLSSALTFGRSRVSHREVYGSPRIHAQLAEQGYRCSRKRIARLMRENGITASRKRRRVVTTHSRHENPVAPNLLQRDCTAQAPHRKWATDITSIPTAQGWLYLAVVLDVYSRRARGLVDGSFL
jgi:putative transposase